jgi:hypothetical protein
VFRVVFTTLAAIADWVDPDARRPSTILLSTLFISALGYYYFRLRERSATWLAPTSEGEIVPGSKSE